MWVWEEGKPEGMAIRKRFHRQGGGPSVKFLPLKHGDLNLGPQHRIEKLDIVLSIYSLSTEEAEAGGFLELTG